MIAPIRSLRRIGVALLSAMTMICPALAQTIVRIETGFVEGTLGKGTGIRIFKGIPFAAPPLGELRWREPRPAPPWQGIRKADEFGPRPMQARIFDDMVFRDKGPSEDCLYLNVWTPAKSRDSRLPVMVWIFGGGFEAGSASEPRQDGESLSTKGVVVVSFNYRLGVFGFLAHPELTRESGHDASGDYGIMDQIAALRWVKRNIGEFGGDPANVTIFGESAGSYSVSALMASPLARGLFQKAIGESGSLLGSRKMPGPTRSLGDAEKSGEKLAAKFDARSISRLRALPAEALLKASGDDWVNGPKAVVDGYVIPKDVAAIFSGGDQSHVPLLAGWNADELRAYDVFGHARPTAKRFISQVRAAYGELAGAVLRLYPAGDEDQAVRSAGDLAGDTFIAFGTWKWIEKHYETGDSPVYRYSFDRAVPIPQGTIINGKEATGEDLGAVHASDISYVFGNIAYLNNVSWQPGDVYLSDTMGSYWTNFAKTGNPNGAGLPVWPRYERTDGYEVMHLNTVVLPAPEAHRDRYEFWDSN